MFFRKTKENTSGPIVGKDGSLYIEEGEDYDSDEYETDSDYEDSSNDGDIIENDEDHDDDVDEGDHEENGNYENGTNYNEKEKQDVNADEQVAYPNHSDGNLASSTVLPMEMNSNDLSNQNNIAPKKIQEIEAKNDLITEPESVPETAPEVDPNPERVQDETEEEGEEEGSLSLAERRSLLALAAEHDRVDIIKSILQPNKNARAAPEDNHAADALLQLLLNNRLIKNQSTSTSGRSSNPSTSVGSNVYTEEDTQEIFLPPLHQAIASSSVSAVTCLLRMGADPSIRPMIPRDWPGPEGLGAESNGESVSSSPTKDTKWRKFHGLSAWEIAFGLPDNAPFMDTDNDQQLRKKSWFAWSSNNDDGESNTKSQLKQRKSPLNIPPSKLEGIKHAFTAEALRAIGSDEVERLTELLNSGLDTISTSPELSSGRLEIGGKDLLGWCVEMGAIQCADLLRKTHCVGSDSDFGKEELTKEEEERAETGDDVTIISGGEQSSTTLEMRNTTDATAHTLASVQTKLEESESLSVALSTILDNLAEEVSITQGLLFQNNPSNNNSALLSQVRTLKILRSEKEDEISDWEARISALSTELDLVMTWWKKSGGKEEDIPNAVPTSMMEDIEYPMIADAGSSNTSDEINHTKQQMENGNGEANMKRRLAEISAQLELSGNKVLKLRASIADLAEENTRNLKEVEKLGLSGAVKLARSLKEEVREREEVLQNIKHREAMIRNRINMVRHRLEKKMNYESQCVEKASMQRDDDGSNNIECENVNGDDSGEKIKSDTQTQENRPRRPLVSDPSIPPPDTAEDAFAEEDNELQQSEEEEASLLEQADDDDEEADVPSKSIASGKSTTLTSRVDRGFEKYLSLDIWDLILRIIGLGKQSVRRTVQMSGTGIDDGIPSVMIV